MERKGIILHLYYDVGANPADSQITITEVGKEFFAEDLILLGCTSRRIGPSGFYIFGLLGGDEKSTLWLPPNKKIDCNDTLQEFWLRIRYIPSMDGIHVLVRECKEALNYLFLQCRHDFLNDKISTKGKIGQEHILGLGVVDMLRWGKERKLDLNQLKKEEPKKFIPSSAKKIFKYPWDSRRLSINFNNELDKLDNAVDVSVTEYKLRYINGFLKYTIQYGIEKFQTHDNQTIVVDPHHIGQGIYLLKPKGREENICSIHDVMFINTHRDDNLSRVVITRRHEGIPKTLLFSDEETALSFVSLVDGYYRLIEDFHYHLCSEVFSPLLKELSKLKCHGPVRKKWADDRLMQKHLMQKHQKQNNFNYLLRQKSNEFDFYVLTYVIQNQRPELKTIGIMKNPEGRWQCNIPRAPSFESTAALLQYYRKNSDPNVPLERYVPPSAPLDSSIYVCRESIKNDENDDRSNLELKSQVGLISGISERLVLKAEGNFTTVFTTLWEKDPTQLQKVAVKCLKQQFSPQYLEEFMESVHRVTFWKCPTLINIHAICLNPFQVIMENAELGNLEKYLHDNPVAEEDFFGIADQIAQALLHIHGDQQEHSGSNSGYHGAVRTSNVFVFGNDSSGGSSSIKVKLGDPGMLSLYNKLPIDNPFNEERLPWLAPELYYNLSSNNHYSDIYSYGVFLWEVFSVGERPFKSLNLRQIFTTVLFGEGLVPPEGCTAPVSSLIKRCTQTDLDKRPSIKVVVRDLGKLIQECSGPHMYNQVQQGFYNMDSGDGSEVSESEQNAVIDSLMEQSKLSSFEQSSLSNRSLVQTTSQISSISQVPLSPAASSLNSFIHWDSRTPLVQQSSGVSSLQHQPSIERQDSIDTNVSGASRATMTTLLDAEAASGGGAALIKKPSIQLRPLPPKPLIVPLKEMTHIVHPNRLEVHDSVILGKGHYGQVHTAHLRLPSGEKQKVAVKSLKADMYQQFHEEFERECKMMTQLEHPHIVQIIGQCNEKENHNTLLVMEFVENGCLRDYLQNKINHIKKHPDREAQYNAQLPLLLRFSSEVAKGMIYLAEQKIVHRDLAARNVLVTKDISLKISDFGLARILASEKDYYSMSDQKAEIPAYWCAPESLHKKKFSVRTDVWSYGVTMWEIFSFGRAPRLCKVQSLYYVLDTLGKRLLKPGLCPESVYNNIMLKCWDKEPRNRLSFEKIDEEVARERKYHDKNMGTNLEDTIKKLESPGQQHSLDNNEGKVLERVELPKFQPLVNAQNINLGMLDSTLTLPKPNIVEVPDPHTLSFMPPMHLTPPPGHPTQLSQDINGQSMNIQNRSLPEIPSQVSDGTCNHELDPAKLDIKRESSIGEGHYGQVYRGLYLQKEVAVKLLKSKMVSAHQEEFNKECEMMTKLNHPHVVRIVGHCTLPENFNFASDSFIETSALVMEYVAKGSLSKHLVHFRKEKDVEKLRNDGVFHQLVQYLVEIAEGMIYLHSKKIIHRDLASRNILVTSDCHMKISDFGLARILDFNKEYYRMLDQTKNIPLYWCAPESLEHKKFSVNSDIWSYGVVMWEVFTFGDHPQQQLGPQGSSLVTAFRQNKRLDFPKQLCTQDIYKNVMLKCWDMDPQKRLPFQDILKYLSSVS